MEVEAKCQALGIPLKLFVRRFYLRFYSKQVLTLDQCIHPYQRLVFLPSFSFYVLYVF
ncbi:hypothetical protein F0230_17535 [Vibrio aestuarianus]|nr:hypothetical protein [Vibrio aestuarianus]